MTELAKNRIERMPSPSDSNPMLPPLTGSLGQFWLSGVNSFGASHVADGTIPDASILAAKLPDLVDKLSARLEFAGPQENFPSLNAIEANLASVTDRGELRRRLVNEIKAALGELEKTPRIEGLAAFDTVAAYVKRCVEVTSKISVPTSLEAEDIFWRVARHEKLPFDVRLTAILQVSKEKSASLEMVQSMSRAFATQDSPLARQRSLAALCWAAFQVTTPQSGLDVAMSCTDRLIAARELRSIEGKACLRVLAARASEGSDDASHKLIKISVNAGLFERAFIAYAIASARLDKIKNVRELYIATVSGHDDTLPKGVADLCYMYALCMLPRQEEASPRQRTDSSGSVQPIKLFDTINAFHDFGRHNTATVTPSAYAVLRGLSDIHGYLSSNQLENGLLVALNRSPKL